MIRPRLRPTVSRRNKYISIAPRAERKLYRESRRGSHDLRRLVGHANFLDVLVDSLDPQSEDDEEEVQPSNSHSTEPADDELSGDSSIASEDEQWSDGSDDEEHALSRTASGLSLINVARAARAETEAAIVASSDDYFSRPSKVRIDDVASLVEDGKDSSDITVIEVASPLNDLMEELEFGSMARRLLQEETTAVDDITTGGNIVIQENVDDFQH